MNSTIANNLLLAGYILGVLTSFAVVWFCSDNVSRYRELLADVKDLIKLNDGIVTAADLTFQATISPTKARKFLDRLAVQLDGGMEITEDGKIYYRFATAKNLKKELPS